MDDEKAMQLRSRDHSRRVSHRWLFLSALILAAGACSSTEPCERTGGSIQISMDGQGCWADNVFIERLWRSVKYEEVYLRAYETVSNVRAGLTRYFTFFNHRRPHAALTRCIPDAVYFRARPTTATSPRAIPLIPAA